MPPVPVAHSVTLRDLEKLLIFFLNHISYKKHKWLICENIKEVTILNGLQIRLYEDYILPLHSISELYVCSEWSLRNSVTPGCRIVTRT